MTNDAFPFGTFEHVFADTSLELPLDIPFVMLVRQVRLAGAQGQNSPRILPVMR